MLGWLFSKLTSGAVKEAAGAIHEAVGTAKDIQDIQKGKIDIELAKRELEREKSPIQLANLDDVKAFDPKYQTIKIKATGPLKYENVLPAILLCLIAASFALYYVYLRPQPAAMKRPELPEHFVAVVIGSQLSSHHEHENGGEMEYVFNVPSVGTFHAVCDDSPLAETPSAEMPYREKPHRSPDSVGKSSEECDLSESHTYRCQRSSPSSDEPSETRFVCSTDAGKLVRLRLVEGW